MKEEISKWITDEVYNTLRGNGEYDFFLQIEKKYKKYITVIPSSKNQFIGLHEFYISNISDELFGSAFEINFNNRMHYAPGNVKSVYLKDKNIIKVEASPHEQNSINNIYKKIILMLGEVDFNLNTRRR